MSNGKFNLTEAIENSGIKKWASSLPAAAAVDLGEVAESRGRARRPQQHLGAH